MKLTIKRLPCLKKMAPDIKLYISMNNKYPAKLYTQYDKE